MLNDMISQANLDEQILVDSCGTGGWHIGESAHKDSLRIVQEHGLSLEKHRARQISTEDLETFDLLIAMDQQNKHDVESLTDSSLHIKCLREFDLERDSLDVPDPYFGGPEGFEQVYNMIYRSCSELLRYIQSQIDQK